jgi:DNA-binding MarR family transcriptional regulator
MLHPVHPPRLKYAQGHVLAVLQDYAEDGMCTLSYDSLASLSGYCPRTVKDAIHDLIERDLIAVTKLPRDRRNSYLLR